MIDLAQQLRQAIARSGFNRKQIADRAGLPYATVFTFVAGENDMRLSSASRIADVVGVELKPKRRKA